MNTFPSRAERRRASTARMKAAKRSDNQPKPNPEGNRATRRAALSGPRLRVKVTSREDTVRKKKYRRFLRKHGRPVTKWQYLGCVLPSAA